MSAAAGGAGNNGNNGNNNDHDVNKEHNCHPMFGCKNTHRNGNVCDVCEPVLCVCQNCLELVKQQLEMAILALNNLAANDYIELDDHDEPDEDTRSWNKEIYTQKVKSAYFNFNKVMNAYIESL
jgi:hypothetical protein